MKRLILGFALVGVSSVQAAVQRYVSADGKYGQGVDGAVCYTTLQAALKDAGQYDTIWITNGFECLPSAGIDENSTDGNSTIRVKVRYLTIRGESGDWRTGPVIRGTKGTSANGLGPGANRCAVIDKDGIYAQFIGVRFEDGWTSGTTGKTSDGGSVYAPYAATFSNCLFATSGAGYGGGVFGNNVSIYASTISNCYSTGYANGTCNCSVYDSTFVGNKGTTGAFYGGAAHTAVRCTFKGNKGTSGVAVYGSADGCSVRDSTIIENTGGSGNYGVAYGYVSCSNCTFTGNYGYYGGCLASMIKSKVVQEGACVARNCTFTNNLVSVSMGSVGYHARFENCRIENNAGNNGALYGGSAYNTLIAHNESDTLCTGVSGDGPTLLVNCTVVSNHVADSRGSTLSIPHGASAGSALTLVNTIVAWNDAPASDEITSATNSFYAVAGVPGVANVVGTNPRLTSAVDPLPFRPKVRSDCRGKGCLEPWMSDVNDVRSRDLAGVSRLYPDGKVDMGCYRGLDPRGLTILLK